MDSASLSRIIWNIDPEMGFKGAKCFSITPIDDSCAEIFFPLSGPRIVAKFGKAFERAGFEVVVGRFGLLIEKKGN